MRLRRQAPLALGAAFAISGVAHLVRPGLFEGIMPRVLPRSTFRPIIYATGLAELVLAAGLGRRRAWARRPSLALLVAVFPANVQMAIDSGSGRLPGAADNRLLAWGRLPVQAVLMWAALQ